MNHCLLNKTIIIVFLVCTISLLQANKGFSQDSLDVQKWIKTTIKLAKKLDVKIRTNIKLDSALKVIIDPKRHSFNTAFTVGGNPDFIVNYNLDSIKYYLKPKILVSQNFYDILTHKIDPSKIIFIKVESIFIHELVHYIQVTDSKSKYFTSKETDNISMRNYISQPEEFEAWSVQAHYYVKNTDKEKYKEIKKLNLSKKRSNELFINEYYKVAYPQRIGVLFP